MSSRAQSQDLQLSLLCIHAQKPPDVLLSRGASRPGSVRREAGPASVTQGRLPLLVSFCR